MDVPHNPDALIPELIEAETPCVTWPRLRAIGFREIGSTNDEALNRARNGEPQGTLVFAEAQTAGRGRTGRAWVSKGSAGLYFSLLLRPAQPQSAWPLLGHAAAVALVRVLRQLPSELSGARPLVIDLKWPNDVLLSGKKTAGILLEVAAGAAVVGVGINVRPQGITDELKDIATCIDREAGVAAPRRWLLVSYLYQFQLLYDAFERGGFREIVDEWKSASSMWNGVPIWIIDGEDRRPAVTCGVTDTGALRVRTPDGHEDVLLAGDVTIRRI